MCADAVHAAEAFPEFVETFESSNQMASSQASVSMYSADTQRLIGECHPVYMYKKGNEGPIRTFRKRWFSWNLASLKLYYYVSDQSVASCGHISMGAFTEIIVIDPVKFLFYIRTIDRLYMLRAEEAHTLDLWFRAINSVIADNRRASTPLTKPRADTESGRPAALSYWLGKRGNKGLVKSVKKRFFYNTGNGSFVYYYQNYGQRNNVSLSAGNIRFSSITDIRVEGDTIEIETNSSDNRKYQLYVLKETKSDAQHIVDHWSQYCVQLVVKKLIGLGDLTKWEINTLLHLLEREPDSLNIVLSALFKSTDGHQPKQIQCSIGLLAKILMVYDKHADQVTCRHVLENIDSVQFNQAVDIIIAGDHASTIMMLLAMFYNCNAVFRGPIRTAIFHNLVEKHGAYLFDHWCIHLVNVFCQLCLFKIVRTDLFDDTAKHSATNRTSSYDEDLPLYNAITKIVAKDADTTSSYHARSVEVWDYVHQLYIEWRQLNLYIVAACPSLHPMPPKPSIAKYGIGKARKRRAKG